MLFNSTCLHKPPLRVITLEPYLMSGVKTTLTLRDAHASNADLRDRVLSKSDAIVKWRDENKPKSQYYRDDDDIQMSMLLPLIFDDDVEMLSTKVHGENQGRTCVRYKFRGRHFKLSLSYGSCSGCREWIGTDQYDTVVFDRLIPFVQYTDYDESSDDTDSNEVKSYYVDGGSNSSSDSVSEKDDDNCNDR